MSYSKEEVAKQLKNAVEWLIDQDEGCVTIKLDDKLGICVGWLPGYGEEKRDDCIQSVSEPDFAINAGIKIYTSDDMRTDYEFINMPYYENGEVVQTDVSVVPNEDYVKLAEYLLNEYEGLKDLDIEDDGLIIEHKDESLKEDDAWEKEFKKIESKYKGKRAIFTHLDDYTDVEELEKYEGQPCDIVSADILDGYDDGGFKYCYWVIEFDDGTVEGGIPGVALDLVEDESLKEGHDVKTKIFLEDDKSIYVEYDFEEKKYYIASDYDRYQHAFETPEQAESYYKNNKKDIKEKILDESLKEDLSSLSQEELNKLVDDLIEKFEQYNVYYTIWAEDDYIYVDISWGDWKHDHLWCGYIVRDLLQEKGYILLNELVDVTEEDGSDTYSATHAFRIKKL